MKCLPHTISRLARIAFWPALMFALIMALLPKPPHLLTDDLGDKFHHMVAFFTLTVLAGVAWTRAPLLRIVLWLAIMGAAIEVLQAIPALHRTADWRDWVADVAAIVCGLIPAQVFRRLAARTGQA